MHVDEWTAAGLYDPASPKAAERLELLEWLRDRGMTTDQMKDAAARGPLVFAASRAAQRPGPFFTQEELATRLGVPLEDVERFRLAFGLPPVPPDAPWCNEQEARMFESVAVGVGLFGGVAMQRLARVVGSSVARLAEAMATTNYERLRRLAEGGATERELAEANIRAIEGAGAPASIAAGLLPIHLHFAVQRIRERRGSLSAETVPGCVGFVDLVGSTTLTRNLDARQLAALVDRFEDVAHEVATNRRGRVVKFIGDEVMFVTVDAASACDIALAMIEAFEGDPAVTPRGGLACGELLDRAGDYYGPVVNLAARLAELAVPREVLVSSEVASRLDGDSLRAEPAGRRVLRGFDEPIPVASVARG